MLLWVFSALESKPVGRQIQGVHQQYMPKQSVTILFAGDVTFAYRFEQFVGARIEYPFWEWHTIGNYDCMMVNLENPITLSEDSVKRQYVFKMHPRYLQLLKHANISIVNCANNHMGDFGAKGIIETIEWLNSAGIASVGIGRTINEARKPYILRKHGISIGFLGYGSDGVHIASQSKPGTLPPQLDVIISDIQKLRPLVDFIVINLHWGIEKAIVPTEQQKQLGRAIIDAGADIIVGHHSHVLQGYEQYKHGLICYSLGNFIFGGNANAANTETAVLKVEFTKNSWQFSFEPVVVELWQPKYADMISAQRINQILVERSRLLNQSLVTVSNGGVNE